jgi:hypothetical protein
MVPHHHVRETVACSSIRFDVCHEVLSTYSAAFDVEFPVASMPEGGQRTVVKERFRTITSERHLHAIDQV